jgi:hypothetical protein
VKGLVMTVDQPPPSHITSTEVVADVKLIGPAGPVTMYRREGWSLFHFFVISAAGRVALGH